MIFPILSMIDNSDVFKVKSLMMKAAIESTVIFFKINNTFPAVPGQGLNTVVPPVMSCSVYASSRIHAFVN